MAATIEQRYGPIFEAIATQCEPISSWKQFSIRVLDSRAEVKDNGYNFLGRFFSLIVSLVRRVLSLAYVPKNNALAYFQHVFGKKRVYQIFVDARIGRQFTKETLHTLYNMLAEPLLQDYQELFDEIKGQENTIRFLNEEETRQVRDILAQALTFSECTVEQQKVLTSILLPSFFTEGNRLFLNEPPNVQQLAISTGLQSDREKLTYAYEFIRAATQVQPMDEANWFLLASKVIARYHPRGGAVVPLPSGRLAVVERIEAERQVKYVLRSLGRNNSNEGDYVLYVGREPSLETKEWWKEVNEEITEPAMLAVETTRVLSNLRRGENNVPRTAVGFSLGGLSAANDVAKRELGFTRLVTIASPGVSAAKAEAFKAAVDSNQLALLKRIDAYFECPGDVVDQLGQKHLGAGCTKDKVALAVHVLDASQQDSKELHSPAFEIARNGEERQKFVHEQCEVHVPILRAVGETIKQTHLRATMFIPHVKISIENTATDDEHLVQEILQHTSSLTRSRWTEFQRALIE